MDYQKMWYAMKEQLMKEVDSMSFDETHARITEKHLKAMAEIEIRAMQESQRVCECGGCCNCNDGEPEPPKGSQAKPDPEATADKCRNTEEKPDDANILKRIFGDDFVSDVETLEKKIREGEDPVIMVDGNLEIPEHLEKEAREKNIAIAHAHCGEISMGKVVGNMPFPFPFPFPPGFLK